MLPHSQSLDLGRGKNPRNPFHATTSNGANITPSEDERMLGKNLWIQWGIYSDHSRMETAIPAAPNQEALRRRLQFSC